MEITPFIGTIIGNLIIAVGIILAVLIVKFITKKFINYVDYITAITVGLLIGIIFLGFIPELANSDIEKFHLGLFLIVGLFIFYIFELLLHWHHCKDLSDGHTHVHEEEHKSGNLIFIGTFLHNAFHGIIIFSAFSANFGFGIITTIAILLHSIPQNVVNYVMNSDNLKMVIIVSFGGVFGALITYPINDFLIQNQNYILAIISGGLLYTALVDIFPNLSGNANLKNKIIYLCFVVIGALIFIGFRGLTHGQANHKHNHEYEEHNSKHLENN